MKPIHQFRILFILTVLVINFSCANEKESAIPTIPIDPAQSEIDRQLSDIIDDISVVHLEKNQDCLLGPHPRLKLLDQNNILIISENKLYFFDNHGEYISTFDAQGNGPEEYRSLLVTLIDPLEEMIYVVEDKNIKTYYYNREYIGTSKLPFRTSGAFRTSGGSWIIPCLQFYNHEDRDLLYLLNPDLSTRKIFKSRNPDVITDVRQGFMYYVDPYELDGRVFFKEMFVDTIFEIKDTILEPHWHLDVGDHKMPTRIGISPEAQSDATDKIPEMAIRETRNHFFLEYYYDMGLHYCIYDKEEETYIFHKEYREEDFPEGAMPILGVGNDLIENAPNFWPNYVHNNIMVSIIYPANLNEEQLSALNCKIDDNPLLIIGRCK